MDDHERSTLWIWRHPKPIGAAGLCVGRCDLAIDPRRAKRLAHRVRSVVRREGLPREVWTSSLQRCAEVGRALARQGFVHHIDDRLAELDFGRWDGRAWRDIGRDEVDAWEADFAHHAPGGGECLSALVQRVREFVDDSAGPARCDRLLIGHAGWINALQFLDRELPASNEWPSPLRYGQAMRWPVPEPAHSPRQNSRG